MTQRKAVRRSTIRTATGVLSALMLLATAAVSDAAPVSPPPPPPPPQACFGQPLGCFAPPRPPSPDDCTNYAVSPAAVKACYGAQSARSQVFTIAGSAPGTVGASYSTARNVTFDTVSGAYGTLLTTYDGVLGDPNEAVANVVVGTVAPAAGTVEVLSNGNALVLDASNSVVDTVTPPVVHDGNDTIDTTLVASGNQLDAVLEQPVAAGSTATISIPVRAYPGGTTGAEFAYCLRHYFQCRAVKKLSDQALASASRRFPTRSALNDGKGDAYRHCYWNGLMTRHYDASTAKGFGDRHEDHGPLTGETRAHYAGAKNMDLYNNAVGRMFGTQSGATTRTVFQDCLDAARAGNLRTIDPNTGNIVTPGVYAVTP